MVVKRILKTHLLKNLLVVTCFLFVFHGFAGMKVSDSVQITGTLVKWNEKLNLAWIFYKGQMVRVPISSLKGRKELKDGMLVFAHVKLNKLKNQTRFSTGPRKRKHKQPASISNKK